MMDYIYFIFPFLYLFYNSNTNIFATVIIIQLDRALAIVYYIASLLSGLESSSSYNHNIFRKAALLPFLGAGKLGRGEPLIRSIGQ